MFSFTVKLINLAVYYINKIVENIYWKLFTMKERKEKTFVLSSYQF